MQAYLQWDCSRIHQGLTKGTGVMIKFSKLIFTFFSRSAEPFTTNFLLSSDLEFLVKSSGWRVFSIGYWWNSHQCGIWNPNIQQKIQSDNTITGKFYKGSSQGWLISLQALNELRRKGFTQWSQINNNNITLQKWTYLKSSVLFYISFVQQKKF